MSQHCRSCDAEIFWAISPAFATLPIDVEPRADGEYAIAGTASGGGTLMRKARPEDVAERYTSHFRTCPNASSHSKKMRRLA